MTDVNMTSYDAIAKDTWPQSDINRLMAEQSPGYGILPRKTDFYGRNARHIALRYSLLPGRSKTFTRALQNSGAPSFSGFQLTRAKDYCVVSLDTETRKACKGQKGAIVDVLTEMLDAAMDSIALSLNTGCYRNSGASVGQLNGSGSAIASNTWTMLNDADISNIEKGMWLNLGATDGTSGSVAPGRVQVSTVDRANNQFVVSDYTQITGGLDNMYVFVDGDFGVGLSGYDAWVPSSAPGATTFYGVDRTQDLERLGGVRYSATSGAPIEQTLQSALGYLAKTRAKPSHALLNNVDWMKAIVGLGSRAVTTWEKGANGIDVGWDALVIAGPKGNVKVLSDPFKSASSAKIIQQNTWEFATLDEIGFIGEEDGMVEATADATQWRIGYYGNISCSAPGWNAHVTL